MQLKDNEVYTFKLNSGEELIAKVISTDGSTVTLTHPVSVAPNPQGMGLIPSMFTSDTKENVTLNTNSVSICAPTDEAVKAKYIEATTGISVPSKKLILG